MTYIYTFYKNRATVDISFYLVGYVAIGAVPVFYSFLPYDLFIETVAIMDDWWDYWIQFWM